MFGRPLARRISISRLDRGRDICHLQQVSSPSHFGGASIARPGKLSGSGSKSQQEPDENEQFCDVWYYADPSGRFGPYSLQQLKDEVARLPCDSFYVCDGMADWQRGSAVPELADADEEPGLDEGCDPPIADGTSYVEQQSLVGPNRTGRRIAAFIIDIFVANCIALAIPWVIAEATNGRYRLTEVPPLHVTYCTPDAAPTAATFQVKEMGLRSPPPRKTFVRTQQCTTLLNLFLRGPYVTAEFQSDNAPGLLIYSILVDFSGNAALITPLNPYINYFLMLFIAAFLLACWLGSLGTWLLKIRIVTLVGSKLGILQFAARSAIIMIVFAPLLFVFSYPWLSIGSTFILAMTLLFPWFKGNFKYRRGLQDVLAGTMVVRA